MKMLEMLFQRSYGVENRLFWVKKREAGEEKEPLFIGYYYWKNIKFKWHILLYGLESIFNGKMRLKNNGIIFHLRHGLRH